MGLGGRVLLLELYTVAEKHFSGVKTKYPRVKVVQGYRAWQGWGITSAWTRYCQPAVAVLLQEKYVLCSRIHYKYIPIPSCQSTNIPSRVWSSLYDYQKALQL